MNQHFNPADHHKINIVRAASEIKHHASDIENLLRQLTSQSVIFTEEDFQKIIESANCHLYLAIDPFFHNKIIGMVSMVLFRVPTALHARIEDLVVDQNYRGSGIGEKLMLSAIDSAKNSGARLLELTSNEQRIAANRLYHKLNFQLINTNVYRLYF